MENLKEIWSKTIQRNQCVKVRKKCNEKGKIVIYREEQLNFYKDWLDKVVIEIEYIINLMNEREE